VSYCECVSGHAIFAVVASESDATTRYRIVLGAGDNKIFSLANLRKGNMELETRVSALTSKHIELEHAIDQETQHPMPDSLRISEWKREKLRIKDEIYRLQHD